MAEFNIKLVEGLIKKMGTDYKKLIAVIRSMSSYIHIKTVRNYINLYYRKNGDKHMAMIEYYFKVKCRNL
jgi:hypothetical protein